MFYLSTSEMAVKRQATDWPSYYRMRSRNSQTPLIRDFYKRGIVAADTPLSEVEFVAMDFETTGLNPKRDAILSIGIVPFTLSRIEVPNSHHWLINPKRKIPAETVIVHKITESELVGKPDLYSILPELLEHLANKVMVVHHLPIERTFLNRAVKRRHKDELLFPIIDTMAIENDICRQGWRDFWLKITGRERMSVRLGNSRMRYGLPLYQAHHALTDALATAELFQAQVAHHFSPDQPVSDFWQ